MRGNKTQGFGHRLFSAADSSCVTHVSFTLSPQAPSCPSLSKPRLMTASIYLKRTRAPLNSVELVEAVQAGKWKEAGIGSGGHAGWVVDWTEKGF